MRVAILGVGAIGLGSAALLLAGGHEPVLWTPRGGATGRLVAEGALECDAAVEVAKSCAEAVSGAEAVLVAVPGPAYRTVLDALAEAGRPRLPVLISGQLSFAALELSRLGVAPIGAWGTTAVTGRRTGPGRVRLSSVRAEVDVAAVPSGAGEAMLGLSRALFGDRFRARDGLLAITLSNVNPQNHLAIALCNFTRIERGERWGQNSHITASVGRLMEALDAERLAIAAALGLAVRTLRAHFHLSFDTPEAPLGEMAAALAARGNDPVAPASLETRYVLEDAPFGLEPIVRLGRLCGVPAPLHEAGLRMFSALYGRDLAAANDLLPALGFDGMSLQRLRQVTEEGWS